MCASLLNKTHLLKSSRDILLHPIRDGSLSPRLSPAVMPPVFDHAGCRHMRGQSPFYAQRYRRCMQEYPLMNNRGVTSIPGCQKHCSKARGGENESEEKAPRLSECQMWGAGGGGPPGGLRVRLLGETRGVHRIRHAHWHTHTHTRVSSKDMG